MPECTKTEAVYRRIRARIVRAEIRPGQLLSGTVLARELGIGVTPIRSALTRLSAEGMLTVLPRTGYVVRSLTVRDVDELFVAWSFLGPAVIRRGLADLPPSDREGATDSVLDGFAPALRVMRTVDDADRRTRLGGIFADLDTDLHRVVAALGGQPELRAIASLHLRPDLALSVELGADEAASRFARYIGEVHRAVLAAIMSIPSVSRVELPLLDTDGV